MTDEHDYSNLAIYAFIADGQEGLISMQINDQHFPMVCLAQAEATMPAMKRAAVQIAKATRKTIRLYKFSNREELEVFKP